MYGHKKLLGLLQLLTWWCCWSLVEKNQPLHALLAVQRCDGFSNWWLTISTYCYVCTQWVTCLHNATLSTVLPSPAITPPCCAATPHTQHLHRLPTAEDATDHHQIGKELLGVRQRLGVTCLLCDISLLVDRQPGTLDWCLQWTSMHLWLENDRKLRKPISASQLH